MEEKTLEQVLAELKEAEKEFKEKCIKYGIEEKKKRKKKDDPLADDEEENLVETEIQEETKETEENKETSEN